MVHEIWTIKKFFNERKDFNFFVNSEMVGNTKVVPIVRSSLAFVTANAQLQKWPPPSPLNYYLFC